jgi:hypothetical protein
VGAPDQASGWRVKPPRITDIRADWLYTPDRMAAVKEFTLRIPHRLPSLNEIIDMKANQGEEWARAQWSQFKEAYEKAVRLQWVLDAIQRGQAAVIRGRYKATYTLLCGDKKTDPSNLFAGAEKVILDALVRCGALEGDGFKHHRDSKFEAIESKSWCVVVKLRAA